MTREPGVACRLEAQAVEHGIAVDDFWQATRLLFQLSLFEIELEEQSSRPFRTGSDLMPDVGRAGGI